LAALACSCALALAPSAVAGPIDIHGDTGNSTEGLGDFDGTIDYTFTGGDTGTLIIELTNTSNPGNGGFLTAFVFNINSEDDFASATLSSTTDDDFENITGDGLEAPPFGTFEAGAGLNGDFTGGGNPSDGIAVGDTETFIFDVIASDAATLESRDFILGPNEFDFVARFRGFEDGGSDKVPGVPVNIIPLPPAAALAGAGLPLVLWLSRRRK
jgi:hypothetical protein